MCPLVAIRTSNVWNYLACAIAALLSTACLKVPPAAAVSSHLLSADVSRDDAIADIETLFRYLESVHPNPYITRSREQVADDRRRIIEQLPPSVSRIEFWMRLSPLIALLGDGHTSLWFPGEEIDRAWSNGEPLFPASVTRDDQQHVVIGTTFTDAIRPGDRLVSVNGRSAHELVAEWMALFSGESDSFRVNQVMGSFRTLLWIHGLKAPFTVRTADATGYERDVVLNGMSVDALRKAMLARPAVSPPLPSAPLGFRMLPSDAAYIDFASMSGDRKRFQRDLANVFGTISSNGTRTLIVDLRSNGGGDTRWGEDLLRHITKKAYRIEARKEWKMSAEYRRFIKSALPAAVRWMPLQYVVPAGWRMFTGPPGKIVMFEEKVRARRPARPFFSGATCFLIGAGTFSSAVGLADAVKTYQLATLVGEETGGHATSFGEVYPLRLPRTGIGAQISSARFLSANGDAANMRPVRPDIPAPATAEARLAGRDMALERAASYPAIP